MSEVLTAVSALDEQVLKAYSVSTPAEIDQSMITARSAAAVWAKTDLKQRIKVLAKLQSVMLSELDSITEVIMSATGKVKTEVILGEIYPVLALLRYYQKNAASILSSCPVHTAPLLFPQASAAIERRPYGVVAIISPWNFPFQLTLNPLLTALFCGNACVFKMPELSLPVGDLLIQLLSRLALPEGLVQQLIGKSETGEQLINARPDLVFFTGRWSGGYGQGRTASDTCHSGTGRQGCDAGVF
jgi:acyl-CoA reductase-like NAD-dependent aldehyde dehydrogenase